MRTIILLADDGETLRGLLAEHWGEVPLVHFAQLAAAETLPARVEATAALVGLPAEPLLEDTSLYARITEAAPWLFEGQELPAVDVPLAYFTHGGTTYQHCGNLDKINAYQLEALYTLQQDYRERPLDGAPALLAILYRPEGQPQTAEVVAAAAAALRTLPMSIAWPALSFFLRSGAESSLRIRTVSALSAQVGNLLAELETMLKKPGASTTCSSRLLRFLARRWLANVRKML